MNLLENTFDAPANMSVFLILFTSMHNSAAEYTDPLLHPEGILALTVGYYFFYALRKLIAECSEKKSQPLENVKNSFGN